MVRLRSDLWCAAFMRRHNDLGHFCVVARKGDPTAGQIWVVVDHLNGVSSLFTPAPVTERENTQDRLFQCRYRHEDPAQINERITQEARFDPDLWVINLDLRGDETGLELVD